jgi:DNA invertase Pin-like site-specific DNA recombinase
MRQPSNLTSCSIAHRVAERSANLERQVGKDKGQTTETLEQWAANAGCTVVATFEGKVSGRDECPQFDALLKAAVSQEFDMIAVSSSDRLGRSMSHLIEVLETIKGTGVGLYIHTQALDTTQPAGGAMFQMLGMFAEFEREMIRKRVNSGLDRVRREIDRARTPPRTATRLGALAGLARSRISSRKRRRCLRLVTVS